MSTLARRVVTHLPLPRLWDANTFLPHTRERSLYEEDAASLVLAGTARIVVAELGEALRWLPPGQTRAFWIHEAAPRLLVPHTPHITGGHAYAASLWTAEDATPILLLEVRE